MFKRLLLIFSILLILTSPSYALVGAKGATALTGGDTGALDSYDGSTLNDGDMAFVSSGNNVYVYRLDSDSALTESSPSIIAPDSSAGDKRWILQGYGPFNFVSSYGNDLDAAVTAIGSTETELFIDRACTISADTTAPSTLVLNVLKTGSISGDGFTLTAYSPYHIKASLTQVIKTGTMSLAFTTKNGWVSPFWWGGENDPGDDSTDSGTAINAALATGCNMVIPAGTYSTTTGIVQSTSYQVVEAYGVTLRVNADVIGWQIGVTGGASNVSAARLLGNIYIRNYSGSSTKAAIRLESLTYGLVEYGVVYDFRYGVELLSSGALGCVYNDIYCGYTHVNDPTNGYAIYLNHVSGVAGYVYNNHIYNPETWGFGKYAIYIKKRASGATNPRPTNNTIINPIFSGTWDYALANEGYGTRMTGGHYEYSKSYIPTTTVDDATYDWTASGTEWYLELNGTSGNPFIKTALGLDVVLGSNSVVLDTSISTTLAEDLDATETEITLTDSSGFPAAGRIVVNNELISYTGNAANTLTGCTRGVGYSNATTHTNGDTVYYGYVWGTSGSLAVGEFGWGDPASQGYNTLYIRPVDDLIPGDSEIKFWDPNDILNAYHATLPSQGAYIESNHPAFVGITERGNYNTTRSRQNHIDEFQDGNSRAVMRFKRVGAQGNLNTPMMVIEDSNSAGTTYSQVLNLKAGEIDTTSYYIKGESSAGVAKFKFDGSGGFTQYSGSNTGTNYQRVIETEHTITAGASNDVTDIIPSGSIVRAVTARVTEVITGAGGITGFSIGHNINTAAVPTDADAWGANISLAATTTSSVANYTIAGPIYNNSAVAAEVTLTAVGANFDGTTGKVRLSIVYDLPTPPTS